MGMFHTRSASQSHRPTCVRKPSMWPNLFFNLSRLGFPPKAKQKFKTVLHVIFLRGKRWTLHLLRSQIQCSHIHGTEEAVQYNRILLWQHISKLGGSWFGYLNKATNCPNFGPTTCQTVNGIVKKLPVSFHWRESKIIALI